MKIVPDSNIILALALPLPYTSAALVKMQQWQRENAELIVPTLWSYEIVSSLRKGIAIGRISSEQAIAALESILAMGIEEIPPTPALHQLALEWSGRLNQTVAYDSAYLALAESQQAHFWTADRRLADAAHNWGASWVHHIDESLAS
ncbi:MAG: type II toxin-antitoxin system VapC family toxin [Cyanobacteriota bacterium]|nr:type II toxin-antitoxin system VapC family toxin [Cyanobacteriota bacterium]